LGTVEGAMRNLQVHLDKLRDDAAECAMKAAETNDRQRSERFAIASRHLASLADQVEQAIARET
jgi:hypothetical protein